MNSHQSFTSTPNHWLLLIVLPSLFLYPHIALAENSPFNCHAITVDANKFDLSPLVGEHAVNRTRKMPPTEMVEALRFDLCEELKPLEGVSEGDQCPSGTRACLTTINQKKDADDRIVAVIPLTQTSTMSPSYSFDPSSKSLSITFSGAEYPQPSDSTSVKQSMHVKLICTSDTSSPPKFLSYDGARLSIEWSTPSACPQSDDGKHDTGKDGKGGDDNKNGDNDGSHQEENVGSGVGWFFLMLLLAFIAYFALGAYYNYSTYGARGLDLIPHRDFWQEVPYMLRDVISHLCSNVGTQRSRSGYIAV
ncbi:hypothetical protein AMATHDRAFT_53914 [Amanita thiersii Skay4041]|uniref:Autophagy-related protein 27 n=1 Tax=Amanita thiersii Skay4041 TaxID=703135 RepID=A0A2A9NZQ7_9AGAR|nr:hypothetical protein AMATHDRAFT_53914 [Amanita thiersii Skay4041]